VLSTETDLSLIDQQALYQIFFHNNAPMLIIDQDTGMIEEVNHGAERFYNLRRAVMIGMSFYEVSDSARKETERLIRGEIAYLIQNHTNSDQKIRPVEIHSSTVVLSQKCHTFLIIQDISEKKKTEQLLAYRQRYEQLIASLSRYFIRPDHHEIDQAVKHTLQMVAEFIETEVCFIVMFSNDQSTLKVSHLWSENQDLYKYQDQVYPTELIPDTASVLFRGDQLEITNISAKPTGKSISQKILKETGIRSLLMVPIVSAGLVIGGIGFGSTRKIGVWPEDARNLLQVVGEMIVNVIARRQSEQALRISEQKYRKFFEEDLTADFIADIDGTIKLCNPAFIRIFGFESESDALSGNLNELDGPSGKLKETLTMLPATKLLQGLEFTLRRRDGEKVQVIANIRGIFDEQDQMMEILGYIFDITEHKKTEEQLRGAQRMEAIGRLAGGVAHDFNNLLTVINGYSDLLLNDNNFGKESRTKIEQIKRAGERAAALTGQLLAFSRRQIVKPKILNLNRVISDIEKMLKRLIGENIEVFNILDDSLGNIEIDPGQIEQVIINLAVNARDAMPEGGKLTIETKNIFLDEQFSRRHHPLKPGSYVLLIVRDNGTGMSAETQTHIFEPFFTTKEKGKGTGLGLSTIYGIIKQCHGYILVESALNQGSVFYLYFPRTDGAPEKDRILNIDQESLRGSESVLIVEDDNAVRQLTASFLNKFGYRVYASENAMHALEVCSSKKNHIDLAIIDVIMPDMSGKILSEKLLTLCPEMKILFISGYTDAEIVHYGVLNTGIEFLQKPFDADKLGDKIRKILDSRPAKS
jgi:two-component system cell cycle sensor histidine kinase/response regulator CckA